MWFSWLLLFSLMGNGGATSYSIAPATAAVVPQWDLDGVSLGDTESEVVAVWGKPSAVETDEWQHDCVVWSYGDGRNAGMCAGEVSFVQVTSRAAKVNLNGRELAMSGSDLRRALGKPEFEAEDGWGSDPRPRGA